MTFTVTYRGKDGALHEECIEAADRAGCVAECRQRGVAAMRIVAGSKGTTNRRQDGGFRSRHRLTGNAAILAAVVLVAVGGGMWWWIGRGESKPKATNVRQQGVQKPKAEKPKPPTPRPRAVAQKDAPAPLATNAPSVRSPKEVVSSSVTTNADGAVVEKIVLADGTKKAIVTPPKPIFDNAADQVIAMAISAKPGEAMPPLPDLSGIDEDFAKSFLTPIKVNDDDPENVKELKRNVIEIKKDLLEAVKGGKTVMQALQEHQAAMERMESSRLMAIREMQRIGAEDGIEMAQEFAKKVNEDFEGKGIPAIPVIGTNKEKTRRGSK